MSDRRIADDEVLYRCIRSGASWFEPPERMTSANFKLRDGELGISVYRASVVNIVDAQRRLEQCGVAQTTAGQIRAALDGNGKSLNLDVICVNDENNPGHAEIRVIGPNNKISQGASNALRKLFKLVIPPS